MPILEEQTGSIQHIEACEHQNIESVPLNAFSSRCNFSKEAVVPWLVDMISPMHSSNTLFQCR